MGDLSVTILKSIKGKRRTYLPGDEVAMLKELHDESNLRRLAGKGVLVIHVPEIRVGHIDYSRPPKK